LKKSNSSLPLEKLLIGGIAKQSLAQMISTRKTSEHHDDVATHRLKISCGFIDDNESMMVSDLAKEDFPSSTGLVTSQHSDRGKNQGRRGGGGD
jgi:hypothetical protein